MSQPEEFRDFVLNHEFAQLAKGQDGRAIIFLEEDEYRGMQSIMAEAASPGSLNAALELLADIRAAAGDPDGKMMQTELVQHIAEIREQAARWERHTLIESKEREASESKEQVPGLNAAYAAGYFDGSEGIEFQPKAEPAGYLIPEGWDIYIDGDLSVHVEAPDIGYYSALKIPENNTAAALLHGLAFDLQGSRKEWSVSAALRELANWMDTGGPTYHEAEIISMSLAGPVFCPDATACRKAAKATFLEAAKLWDQIQPQTLSDAEGSE